MGFDIITYDDCIDICMEKCWHIGYKWEKIKEKDEQKKIRKTFMREMKKKLLILRKLHIVHADIKPDNILYSPGWKNVILVDFGLAMIVKESVNEET